MTLALMRLARAVWRDLPKKERNGDPVRGLGSKTVGRVAVWIPKIFLRR